MRKTTITVAALMAMLVTGMVWATDRAVRAEAERLFREGSRLIRQEQYSEALTRFERTQAYRPRPNVLWNTGMCHLYLGHRDMAVWFLDRYLMQDPEARASLEMQGALTEIMEADEYIVDEEERNRLGGLVTAASEAATEGRATAAPPENQFYGVGATYPPAAARSAAASTYGATLFRSGLDQLSDDNWENSRAYFERSLAYRMLRNAAYNVATIHLSYGRRDLAVHFYRLYILNQPEIQRDNGVRAALEAIEDCPPRVGNQARRDELADQMDLAVQRALGDTQSPEATQAEASTTRPN